MNRMFVAGFRLLLLSAVFGFPFLSHAQQFDFSREVQFAQYLQDKELFAEAQFVLNGIDTAALSPLQKDTVHYLKGWGAYTNRQLDTAITSLLQVSSSFQLFRKSRFFAAYCLAYQGKTDFSQEIVSGLDLTEPADREMRAFQLAGMALLERDYATYDSLKPQFTYSLYALQKEEQSLDLFYGKLRSSKRKSPVLAGLYSAVLPGAGKYYAGKKRQGIAAFLPILSLGLVTYEAYRKGGVRSARFITFGSLFSVFYIGNIWGSVLSVKVKQREFQREYDNKILFNLHLPLRNLYN